MDKYHLVYERVLGLWIKADLSVQQEFSSSNLAHLMERHRQQVRL